MTKFPDNMLRGLAVETRGAEIAEAAAVLPLMFMILLGIFWFGQAFSIYGAITRAAQDGARAGSTPYCVTCTGSNSPQTNAANAAQAALQASRLDPTLIRNPSPTPNLLSCSNSTPVACSAGSNSNQFCVQSPVQLTSSGLGATALCGISVTFQYPYQFWLPFTSLSKQKIWLTASARVRMETR